MKILIKHVGNMGDHLFLAGPFLETLKRRYPAAEITLVAAWGYKDSRGRWGERNQDGFCISLMKENPRIDHLIHWHDKKLSLAGEICCEEEKTFPTWNKKYYEKIKNNYDAVYELDFGLGYLDNPVEKMYEKTGFTGETYSNYPFYGSERDWKIGREMANRFPAPRVLFLEGLNGQSMRGWDPKKTETLEFLFREKLGIEPIWFGAKYPKTHENKALSLRENIAFAGSCELGVGVMGGPMHFAAAAGLQTLCLYGGQPLHRAAPSYFLNKYVADPLRYHVTVEGPTCDEPCFLKRETSCKNLAKSEAKSAHFKNWQNPGRQEDKSCVATIPVETVFAAAKNILKARKML